MLARLISSLCIDVAVCLHSPWVSATNSVQVYDKRYSWVYTFSISFLAHSFLVKRKLRDFLLCYCYMMCFSGCAAVGIRGKMLELSAIEVPIAASVSNVF